MDVIEVITHRVHFNVDCQDFCNLVQEIERQWSQGRPKVTEAERPLGSPGGARMGSGQVGVRQIKCEVPAGTCRERVSRQVGKQVSEARGYLSYKLHAASVPGPAHGKVK